MNWLTSNFSIDYDQVAVEVCALLCMVSGLGVFCFPCVVRR